MSDIRVTQLNKYEIPENGRTISVEFGSPSSEPTKLIFPSEIMWNIIQQLISAANFADSKSNLSQQGVRSISTPKQYSAGPTDGDDVIVAFRMENGMEHRFALPSKDALSLASKIDAAARKKRSRAH